MLSASQRRAWVPVPTALVAVAARSLVRGRHGAHTMANDLISVLWKGLRDAGIPEVMLYLADGSASRCHWDDTAMIGDVRVALLGDQERGIVRILPISSCIGIGVPSPKGTDPVGYRAVVQGKLREFFDTPKSS